MRRYTSYLLLAGALLALLGTGPAGAGNDFAFGQNVDPSVVSAIDSGQGGGSFHLLVFGNNLAQADSAAGVDARDSLGMLGGQSVEVDASQAAALAAQPGVQFVTSDAPMAPTGSVSQLAAVSSASLATLYPQIDGATNLWANGVTGAGVGLAIIDSGVTPRADFGSRLVQVQLPTDDGTGLDDSVGHGSAVAGVAAGQSADGQYIGVAPGANIYAINVARADGVYTSDVIAGLNWVLENAKQDNIRVVNLSLSQTEPSSYLTNTLDAAVEQLWQQGIVVVAAAGNFGPNSEEFAPANDPWVITVGASDTNDTLTTADDSLASFSSYGTTPDGFQKPEIVAPGRHIVTTIPAGSQIAQSAPSGYLIDDSGNQYVRISGTSFSAPQVAGAVALILQERPQLNPDQVKWLLTANERPLAGSNAGALDLGLVSEALDHVGNANQGYHWSNWAHPGENTNDFLNAFTNHGAINQAQGGEHNAAADDLQAQLACAGASLPAPTPPAPKPGPGGKNAPSPAPPNPALQACANHLAQAAAAWDAAAQAWSTAGFTALAAADEARASSDWQQGAAAWAKAGNGANASSELADQSSASGRASAWSAAAGDAAAWDAAAWDGATWDAAAWDAAAWDAAAWDYSANWDAAAWDAAAWDAAAWDAAAWD